LSQSAVLSPGNRKIVFTTVVEAPSERAAIRKARTALSKCITDAGWVSRLDDDSGGHAHRLVKQAPTITKADDKADKAEAKQLAGAGV